MSTYGTVQTYRGTAPTIHPNSDAGITTSFGEQVFVDNPDQFDVITAGDTGLFHDITGMTMMLQPGTYRVGFQVLLVARRKYITVRLTTADNTPVPRCTAAGGNNTAGDVGACTIYGNARVTITEETTFKLRAAQSGSGDVARVEDDTWTSIEDPDGASYMYAERIF